MQNNEIKPVNTSTTSNVTNQSIEFKQLSLVFKPPTKPNNSSSRISNPTFVLKFPSVLNIQPNINDKVETTNEQLTIKRGEIRVGRIVYQQGKSIHPSYDGFTPIVVLTKSSKYGSLGPYVLQNEKEQIMENIWQFMKVYETVPQTKAKYSRWNSTIIWDHPAEVHVDNGGKILDSYWSWREKGLINKYPVRYPVGMKNRHTCLYALKEKGGKPLSYIEARKEIYLPIYIELVKKQKQFIELKARLEKGENLLVIEVDGPHQESLAHYKSVYKVGDNFIENDTMLATYSNLQIMLNEGRHPFGHSYCLAMSLMDV